MKAIWWWLSFANNERNLGVALVKAGDFIEAVRRAHALGINPGGEVNGWAVEEDLGLGEPAPKWQHKLITTRAEMDKMSTDWTGHPVVSTLDIEPVDPKVIDEDRNEGS